jgi:hypothetical protein
LAEANHIGLSRHLISRKRTGSRGKKTLQALIALDREQAAL